MAASGKRVALICGSIATVDRDGVGDYASRLHANLGEHATLFVIKGSVIAWLRVLLRIIREFDVAHIQYPSEGWGNSVLPGVLPIILRLSPSTTLVLTLHEWTSMHILRKLSLLPLLGAVDKLIFVTKTELAAFQASPPFKVRIQKPECSCVAIGQNIETPDYDETGIKEAKAALGLPSSAIILSYFGSIYDWKQPYLMLDAVEILVRQGHSVRLLVAGDFPQDHFTQKEDFESYIRRRGVQESVVLLGFVDDVEKLANYMRLSSVALFLFSDGVSSRRSSFWYAAELQLPIITTFPQPGDVLAEELTEEVCTAAAISLVDACSGPGDIANAVLTQLKRGTSVVQPLKAPDWKSVSDQHWELYGNG